MMDVPKLELGNERETHCNASLHGNERGERRIAMRLYGNERPCRLGGSNR